MVHTSHTAYVAMQSLSNNFEQHRFTIPSIFNNIHHTILNSVIPHSELHFHTTSLKVYTSHYLECVVKEKEINKALWESRMQQQKAKTGCRDTDKHAYMQQNRRRMCSIFVSFFLLNSQTQSCKRHTRVYNNSKSICTLLLYKNAFVCTRRHVLTHT